MIRGVVLIGLAVLVAGCSEGKKPTPEEITKACLEMRGHRDVLNKLREDERGILDHKREASAGEMKLLLLRIEAAEAKIKLVDYKANELGIHLSACKP